MNRFKRFESLMNHYYAGSIQVFETQPVFAITHRHSETQISVWSRLKPGFGRECHRQNEQLRLLQRTKRNNREKIKPFNKKNSVVVLHDIPVVQAKEPSVFMLPNSINPAACLK